LNLGTMTVRKQTNLVKRNGVFYLRVSTPVDLRPTAKRREVWLSLRTRDETEARRLVRLKLLEIDHEHETQRARQKAHTAISPELAARMMALYVAQELHRDDEWRRNGTTRENLDAWENIATDGLADWRETAATGRLSRAQSREFDDWIGEQTLGPLTDADRRLLAHGFAKASVKLLELLLQRNAGAVIEVPAVPAAPAGPTRVNGTGALLMSEAFDRWNAERKLSQKTWADWKRALALFVSLHGDMPIGQTQKSHFVALKDALVAQGRAPKTVSKYVGAFSTVLAWCADNALVPVNVASGIRVAKAKVEREKRLPFSSEQLTALFASPVFSRGERPARCGGEAVVWLPLLGVWTGARLEELAQLRVDDVRQEDGHLVIVISDRGVGRVKTTTSRRKIPVAPALEDLGFLRYVDHVRGQRLPDGWLFPELKPTALGIRSTKWSEFFGRYLRDVVGIQDRRVVFHSARHSFRAACRAAGIEEEVADALMGHAGGGVGRRYGAGGLDFPLGPLKEAIGRLRFPDVVLPAPWGPPGKRT
jgi:integrase